MTNRVEREREISPEVITGKDFRVPAIIGEGTGQGFSIDNLHLPKGWGKAIPELKKIYTEHAKLFFEEMCNQVGATAGRLLFDKRTGVLLEATARTDRARVSRIRLSRDFFDREKGVYKMENVYDARVAIVLQKTAVVGLYRIYSTIGGLHLPYVDGNDNGYHSFDLVIPRTILKSLEPVTNKYYRQNFVVEASNIAGRFGVSLYQNQVDFDEKGILRCVYLREGSACSYHRDFPDAAFPDEFYGHNVDNPHQALALHAIVASHINWLLAIEDKRTT